MCLDRLTRKPLFFKLKYGWKVFESRDGALCSHVFDSKISLPIGSWLGEKGYRVCTSNNLFTWDSGERYKVGWHIFKNKWSAKSYKDYNDSPGSSLIIKKVIVKDIVAYGKQTWGKVFVCKKIKILK